MVTLDDLMTFLDDFMGDVGDKGPYMPNDLQVRGTEEVKVLTPPASAPGWSGWSRRLLRHPSADYMGIAAPMP